MGTELTFKYDKVGDILYIEKCPPYAEQESEELDYGVVGRFNPLSDEIENLEILFFSARLAQEGTLRLPVTAEFRRAESA